MGSCFAGSGGVLFLCDVGFGGAVLDGQRRAVEGAGTGSDEVVGSCQSTADSVEPEEETISRLESPTLERGIVE